MDINDDLLKFLKDPENQDLIKRNNFEKLYENAFNQSYWSRFEVSELTEMLYAIDIDPLLYSNNKIPKGFLKESHRKNFEIPEYIVRIEDKAFFGGKFVDMVIPDNVTDIGVATFTDCQSLTNITLSKNITIIKKFMFANCSKLTDVVIPDGVVKIEMAAFKNCTNLIKVVIPNSVTSIEQDIFKRCESLKNIYYKGTGDQWMEIKKSYNWGPPVSATIHCSGINIHS